MKGARAEPSATTNNTPTNSKKKTMGNSHHFLLTLRNCVNSEIIDIFDITYCNLFKKSISTSDGSSAVFFLSNSFFLK